MCRYRHSAYDRAFASHDLDELHLAPEVDQVEQESEHYDHAQYEHVFRGPLYARLVYGHGITLIAASAVVVDGEDQRIDEVQDHQSGQHDRTGQCIPVSAEEFTDHVVTFG